MLTDFFSLPEPVAIEGLHFRYTCGAEDADPLHAVQYRSVTHDSDNDPHIFKNLPTCEDIAGWLENAVKEGRAIDWLVAQVGAQVIGYNEIMGWKEAVSDKDITWVYLNVGWVLPEWRGKGLATAMLHHAENEIRRRAAAEHPGEKVEFAANADTYEKQAAALLLHEGYQVAFTRLDLMLEPSFPLPPPTPVPAGIEVRPVQAEDIPLIQASIVEAYRYENAVCRGYDPEGTLAGLRNPRHNLSLWQVAWDGTSGAGEVAGQVIPVIEKGRGEIFEVSVRPIWRRRGLARCLLLRALHDLKQRGIEDIWLCTISEYPTRAKELYQSVGFRIIKESPRYRKPL